MTSTYDGIVSEHIDNPERQAQVDKNTSPVRERFDGPPLSPQFNGHPIVRGMTQAAAVHSAPDSPGPGTASEPGAPVGPIRRGVFTSKEQS